MTLAGSSLVWTVRLWIVEGCRYRQLADKMLRRFVTRPDLDEVLTHNEIVEVYEQHGRVRYVLLGEVDGRPLHVVVAEDDVVDATVVLSVYEPDEDHGWDAEAGFRSRKEGGR